MKSAVRDCIGFNPSFTKHLFIEIGGGWGANVAQLNVLCTLILLDTSHEDVG